LSAWLSTTLFNTQFILWQLSSSPIGTPQLPLSGLALLYFPLYSVPPPPFGTPWSTLKPLGLYDCYSIVFDTANPLPFLLFSAGMGTLHSPLVPLNSHFALRYINPDALPLIVQSSCIGTGTMQFHSLHLRKKGYASTSFCTLYPHFAKLHYCVWHCSIFISAPLPTLILFSIISPSFISSSVLLLSIEALPIWCSSFPGSYSSCFLEYIVLLFKPHFDMQLVNILLHLCKISQIKPNSMVIQCHPLTR